MMSEPSGLHDTVTAAELNWLKRWTKGPTERASTLLSAGTPAPALTLPDETGTPRRTADRRMRCLPGGEPHPVIIAQGQPNRAARYQAAHAIPCAILSDPDLEAYRAFGVGQWAVERVLYDAPPEYWSHSRELGIEFQDGRRRAGRAPVDDPWRATAEFVVDDGGQIRLAYEYQYCEDYPDARVLTTAATLSSLGARG